MRRRRLIRAAKWLAFFLLAAWASSALAHELLARWEESRLAQRVAAIRASGAPISAAELGQPKVPDAENAALVYQKAFAALSLSKEDEEFLSTVDSGKASLADPAIRERVRGILEANRHAVGLIEQASRMPRCQFPVDWQAGYQATFPHLAKLRRSVRLTVAHAVLLASEGRGDAALAACGTAFRIADSLASERSLISQLVRYAIIAIAQKGLEVILNESQPSAEACRRLASELATVDLVPGLVAALQGERAIGLTLFEQLRTSPDPLAVVRLLSSADSAGKAAIKARKATPPHSPPLRLWLALDALTYLDAMDRAIQLAPLPYPEALSARPLPDDFVPTSPWRPWPPRPVTVVIAPYFAGTARPPAKGAAPLALARTALELQAYRAEEGRYPQSLAHFGSATSHPLPPDPFSGKSLLYHPQGQGFLLYSVGPNLKDDGGTRSKTGPSQGDLPFHCAH